MLSPAQNPPDDLQQKTLKTLDLQALVNAWLQHHKPAKKQPTYHFKFNLQTILPLPQNLLQNVILYVCYVKFPDVLEDLTVEQKMKKNLFLKSIYQQQFYHGKWMKEFFFQFTIVYVTKTASKFISQYFPYLQINDNLQSQIFIILQNVFIGNQIGTKIYHLVSKKYLKQIIRKSAKRKIKASISMDKKESFDTMCKPSTKYVSQVMNTDSHESTKSRIFYGNNSNNIYPQNVNLRRNNRRNKISFVKTDSWQRSNLEMFTEQLKKNLYVEPLPVLEPKKMDISQYEIQKYGSVEVRDKKKLGQGFMKPVHLRTTKMSSSMEAIMTLNHPNLSTHQQNKPGKILLSRQLNSKHYCLTSASIHNEGNQKSFMQVLDKDLKLKNPTTKNTGKFTYEEWNQLLKKIRFNSKNSVMFEKENVNTEKSFDYMCQKHPLSQISHEKYLPKGFTEDPKSTKDRPAKQPLPNKLLTEHHEVRPSVLNSHRKSQSFQNTPNSEQHVFGKLGSYTTSIDVEDQGEATPSPPSQPPMLFKKQSPDSHQKLSKSSKLKHARLTFLFECKKRENKLDEDASRPEIKMALY